MPNFISHIPGPPIPKQNKNPRCACVINVSPRTPCDGTAVRAYVSTSGQVIPLCSLHQRILERTHNVPLPNPSGPYSHLVWDTELDDPIFFEPEEPEPQESGMYARD